VAARGVQHSDLEDDQLRNHVADDTTSKSGMAEGHVHLPHTVRRIADRSSTFWARALRSCFRPCLDYGCKIILILTLL